MAVLPDADRALVTGNIQRTADCPGGITKPQLRAVINALDDWWETTGAASANAAIPQPQRGILTTRQKYALLEIVLMRKVETL